MKLKFIISIVALWMMVSCSNDSITTDNGQKTKGVAVSFSVDDFTSASTRTNIDPDNNYSITWAEGDVVGIFPYEGFQEPFIIPASQVGMASASFDGGYWDVVDGLSYNAYYPFDEANFKSADCKTMIPVDYSEQNQYGRKCNAGTHDFTYSDWAEAKDGNVHFRFHHIGAFYVLNLVIPETRSYEEVRIENRKYRTFPVKGFYDLTEETPRFIPSEEQPNKPLTLHLHDFKAKKDSVATFYIMIPPVDLVWDDYVAVLKSGKDEFRYNLPVVKATAGKLITVSKRYLSGTAVDLGLSVEWADCNIGTYSDASGNDLVGDFYAWGETDCYYQKGHQYDCPCRDWKTGKTGYDWNSYCWSNATDSTLTKYCNNKDFGLNGFTDNMTVLELNDDVAYEKWGGYWRIPTKEEMEELIRECNWEYVINHEKSVGGWLVTSKKEGYEGNSIFLPDTGYMQDDYNQRFDFIHSSPYEGYYWVSSNDNESGKPSYANCLKTTMFDEFMMWENPRCYGMPIRPVWPKY